MNRFAVPVFIVAAAVAVVVLIEMSRPGNIDWGDSFVQDSKAPFGTFILYDQLESIFPGQDISVSMGTAFQALHDVDDPPDNFIFINSGLEFTPTDSDELLEYVEKGGNVFLAAERLSGAFIDSLGVETSAVLAFLIASKNDSMRVNFVSPSLRASEPYAYAPSRTGSYQYVALFDEEHTTVLGVAVDEPAEDVEGDGETDSVSTKAQEDRVNYIRIDRGAGSVYLSTIPRSFANLGMLSRNGFEYASRALSYLPVGSVLWDEHYKEGRAHDRDPMSESRLRFVGSQEALAWAYNLLIVGGLLFVFFGARRRQRVIPVIEPPRNTTLEFVETVGRLYHQNGDFNNVAGKMIVYLLEYIRTHLGLSTATLDQRFVERVSERSGVPLQHVITLFNQVRSITEGTEIHDHEFMQFSDAIEYFYRTTQR